MAGSSKSFHLSSHCDAMQPLWWKKVLNQWAKRTLLCVLALFLPVRLNARPLRFITSEDLHFFWSSLLFFVSFDPAQYGFEVVAINVAFDPFFFYRKKNLNRRCEHIEQRQKHNKTVNWLRQISETKFNKSSTSGVAAVVHWISASNILLFLFLFFFFLRIFRWNQDYKSLA